MDELTNKLIVLFDGVCNLCNESVYFIIRHDAKDRFRFASLQSDIARRLLENHPLPAQKTDSIILINNGRIYIKSAAVLEVSRYLNGVWKLLVIFYIIPRFIRDSTYDLVARNRYKWFGKRKECMMPTEKIRLRFLA